MKIPTSAILPNPQQPRIQFDESEIAELAASMREHGLLHPILVEEGQGTYILIDGERRWRAAQQLGWSAIDAHVRPAANGTGALERTILTLVANLQRADLSPVEEGRAYEALAKMGLPNVTIAHQVGKYPTRIATRRAILRLPEEIQDLMVANLFPTDPRVVAAIESLPAEHRVAFATKLARPGLRIGVVQKAAEKLNAALSAGRVKEEPALHFAHRRAGKPSRPAWDALIQIGQLPPWPGVVKAAHATCAACELRDEASAVICQTCPAVTLLVQMIEQCGDDKR